MRFVRDWRFGMAEMTKIKNELQEAIIKGKRDAVEPLIRQALSEGLSP